MDVSTEELRFPGQADDPVDGFLAYPSSVDEPGPAVVLVHEVFGVDPHMRSVAERLAGEGFVTLLPDLYTREGRPGPAPTADDPAPDWDIDTIRSAANGLPNRRALADLDAAAAFLSARDDVDSEQIAVLGFCMGGTLAFLSCCVSTRFSAGVDFYGQTVYPELSENRPTQPLELALNLDCALLAFFGGQDQGIPPENVERMRQSLDAGAKNHEIITYPNARHGFFNDARAGYDAEVAADAWRRTLAFFHEVL